MTLENLVIDRREKNPDRDYKWLKLSEIVGETNYATMAKVSDVKTEYKYTNSGRNYISNLFRINFYNPDSRTNVGWWIQCFGDYKDGKLTVNEKSDLYDFVCQLTGDFGSSRFVIDFETFKDAVSQLSDIAFNVEERVTKSGFVKYIPKFLAVA